jgi:hypothetical protein
MTTQLAFQLSDGSSILTPSLQRFGKISYVEAYKLVSAYHYLGNKRFIGQYCFGIIKDYQIIGAVVYSPLSVPNSAQSAFGLPRGNYSCFVEMSRLVLEPSLNHSNIASKFIAYSLRELKKKGIKAVISYADSSRHVGTIYQAANFNYYGLTPPATDFWYGGTVKHSRGKIKRHLTGVWKPRTKKHRYIYLLDKTQHVAWPLQSIYPKRNDTHNDD